jgi:hypothetical protein
MTFFQFEADFVESLRCIPMLVRYKLDICGIKLKLNQWHQFSTHDRQTLVIMPCATETEIAFYRDILSRMIKETTGEMATELPVDPYPIWDWTDRVPDVVLDRARSLGVDITLQQWDKLTALQRFALTKLTRSSHEESNFLPALKEFGLAS